MKKLLSIALALVMVMALSVTVFAVVPTTGETSGNVTITYNATNNESKAVYGAEITWTDLSVTYSYGKDWDPESLQYDDVASPTWSDDDVVITITNNSNAKIWSDVTYTAGNGLSAEITGDGEIAAATVGQAATQTVNVVISGTPTSLESTAAGSLTVALSDTAPAQG